MGVCFDYLKDAIQSWINDVGGVNVIVNNGSSDSNIAVDSYDLFYSGNYVVLKATWSSTQNYDGYYLRGLNIGSMNYLLNMEDEVEGGYTYIIRLKFSVDDCSDGHCDGS